MIKFLFKSKGMGHATKLDEFLERFHMAPPPTPQNGPYLWKSCAYISYYLAIIPPCIYALHIMHIMQPYLS